MLYFDASKYIDNHMIQYDEETWNRMQQDEPQFTEEDNDE